MKKTQKVLHLLEYIENMNLSNDELERLISELDSMLIIE
jgi:hypothetical protein